MSNKLKQKNENGDNQLLEKRFVLFISNWKLKCNHWQHATFFDKQQTSEAKLDEKRQNLDSYSKNAKKNYKQGKNVQ